MRIQTGFKTPITVFAHHFINYYYHTYWQEYPCVFCIRLVV